MSVQVGGHESIMLGKDGVSLQAETLLHTAILIGQHQTLLALLAVGDEPLLACQEGFLKTHGIVCSIFSQLFQTTQTETKCDSVFLE